MFFLFFMDYEIRFYLDLTVGISTVKVIPFMIVRLELEIDLSVPL